MAFLSYLSSLFAICPIEGQDENLLAYGRSSVHSAAFFWQWKTVCRIRLSEQHCWPITTRRDCRGKGKGRSDLVRLWAISETTAKRSYTGAYLMSIFA